MVFAGALAGILTGLFFGESGTLRIQQLESIAVFLGLFFAGALGLSFWIWPACLAAADNLIVI
jgi:hypothetical protein